MFEQSANSNERQPRQLGTEGCHNIDLNLKDKNSNETDRINSYIDNLKEERAYKQE